jgi:hypothetical protein
MKLFFYCANENKLRLKLGQDSAKDLGAHVEQCKKSTFVRRISFPHQVNPEQQLNITTFEQKQLIRATKRTSRN